jgi:hypothetical protein
MLSPPRLDPILGATPFPESAPILWPPCLQTFCGCYLILLCKFIFIFRVDNILLKTVKNICQPYAKILLKHIYIRLGNMILLLAKLYGWLKVLVLVWYFPCTLRPRTFLPVRYIPVRYLLCSSPPCMLFPWCVGFVSSLKRYAATESVFISSLDLSNERTLVPCFFLRSNTLAFHKLRISWAFVLT